MKARIKYPFVITIGLLITGLSKFVLPEIWHVQAVGITIGILIVIFGSVKVGSLNFYKPTQVVKGGSDTVIKEFQDAISDLPDGGEIDILTTYIPNHQLRKYAESISEAVSLKKRIRIRLLLIDYKGDDNLLERRFQHMPGGVKTAIEGLKTTYQQMYEMKGDPTVKSTSGSIDVRLYSCIPFGNYMKVGGSVMRVGFLPLKDSGINAPSIIFKDNQTEAWSRFEESFEWAWSDGSRGVDSEDEAFLLE
ncbi:MAG: hypothetical protein AAF916_10210 [Planctomycetota bacterium]